MLHIAFGFLAEYLMPRTNPYLRTAFYTESDFIQQSGFLNIVSEPGLLYIFMVICTAVSAPSLAYAFWFITDSAVEFCCGDYVVADFTADGDAHYNSSNKFSR